MKSSEGLQEPMKNADKVPAKKKAAPRDEWFGDRETNSGA